MREKTIGLVPAAGQGLRLGLPYPKELYPVIENGTYKPVAQYVLEQLVHGSVRHIVFVVNESKHQLIGYFGNGRRFGCDVSYVVQEPPEPGNKPTSGGLAEALDASYHLTRGSQVCFGMPDTLMQPGDVFREVRERMAADDELGMGLFPTTRPEKFGMVDLEVDGRIRRVIDKPSSTTLTHMWGCLVWRPRFSEHLHAAVARGERDFAAIMNSAMQAGMKGRGVIVPGGSYTDLGTYDEIRSFEKEFWSRQEGRPGAEATEPTAVLRT